MRISEELSTEESGVQYVDERYSNVCVCVRNVNNVKLDTCILPSWDFYQWNDFGKSTTWRLCIF